MSRLTSFISFRMQDKRGGFREPPEVHPLKGLAKERHILVLIHGFNNHRAEAQQSYDTFLEQQERLRQLNVGVWAIYWPGDTSVRKYYESIQRAQTTAAMLARELAEAVREGKELVIDVVAHSMGCRLTLELLKELQRVDGPRPHVRRVVFMAAAVPIERLSRRDPVDPGSLRTALEATDVEALSLFSKSDWVLGYTFGSGQRKADKKGCDQSGNPPIALGYREWKANDTVGKPRLVQRPAPKCGHGHYWPSRRGNVAYEVRRFLTPDEVPREIPTRWQAERNLPTGARIIEMGRALFSRRIGR